VRYQEPGTTIVWRSVDRERRIVQTAIPWTVVRHDARGVVLFISPGDAHSFWLARDDATSTLAWWYVNLEEPWRETAIGFDSRDHLLDLWSGPDGEWHWKDEDELTWAIAHGWVAPGRDAELRAEGERALERFKRGDPPLDEPWLDFRPDASWAIPVLSDTWRDFELG